MTEISLFYTGALSLGGRVSYTYYLAESLKSQGFIPKIYEIKAKDEQVIRPFAGDWTYRNVTIRSAVQIARETPTLITALDKRLMEEGIELFRQGVALTVHKASELTPRMLRLLRELGVSVITPISAVRKTLKKQGIEVAFIPYPYPLPALLSQSKPVRAISVGRVERNRSFSTIFQVPHYFQDGHTPEKILRIYGQENRIFTHKEITPLFPGWRELYSGTFEPGSGATVLNNAKFLLDLRDDSQDSIRYPILEAWAAGAIPIVREPISTPKLRGAGPVFLQHQGDEKSLAKLLTREEPELPLEIRQALLKDHQPARVIPAYIQALHIK